MPTKVVSGCRSVAEDRDLLVTVEREFHYKRCAFSTRLLSDRMYTTSHAWLSRQEDALWRVGLTGFAVRVLGEPVEFDIEAKPGAPLEVGQTIGWIEGFKAVTDLFCPMAGVFQSANPELAEEISLLHCDPYGRGWLYLVEGAPDRDCFDVDGYASFLDTTIDRMSGATHGHG